MLYKKICRLFSSRNQLNDSFLCAIMKYRGDFVENLIISIVLLVVIIFYKTFEFKKNKGKKNKKLLWSYLISIFAFFISLFINIWIDGNATDKTLEYLMHAFSFLILMWPFSYSGLEYTRSKVNKKLAYVKTIVTNVYDKKYIDCFKKASISVIVLSEEDRKYSLPVYQEDEKEKYLKKLDKSFVIKTSNKKILKKELDQETTCFWFDDLDKLYKDIYASRGEVDTFVRTIKYLIITYIPIFLSYLFLSMIQFPWNYNLMLVVLLKIITLLSSRVIYSKIDYDVDLMERGYFLEGKYFSKQEKMFLFIQSILIMCFITLPYMFILAQGGSQAFANTLLYIIFIYSNLFMTISYLSEENLFKNLIKLWKNKRILLFSISCIILTLYFNFFDYFMTRNIEVHNYVACICFGFIPVLFNEYIKLARYMTKKGRRKNEFKNNKK